MTACVAESPVQLDLFAAVAAAYAAAPGELSNDDLYLEVARLAEIDSGTLNDTVPIGISAQQRSPVKRKIRWFQQTLKHMGVIERVDGARGMWRLAEKATKDLDRVTAGVKMYAFSTDLGVAIWGRNQDVFSRLDEPVALCITSPPYRLAKARAYGGPPESQYVDFICESLEPILRSLLPGASIILNVTNDSFESKSPARSLYLERLVLALHDRLGLSLMDRHPWIDMSKPPGPTWWACVNRYHLTSCYEHILWFTNDPHKVRSNNLRVLQEHSAKHRKLMERGGEDRTADYGDGAYRLRPGSFGRPTEGKIPRNVIQKGHSCADTRAYRRHAKELGLPLHGAVQPSSISDFYIRFLTTEDELVVDPFGGTLKSGLSAERLGRRWLVSEWVLQFLRGSAELFRGFSGFHLNPALEMAWPSVSEPQAG